MSNRKNLTLQSTTGQQLEAYVWLPDTKPIGVVQLTHGMAEHILRYDHTAQALTRAGYVVVGHTHLGHGTQAKTLGYFADRNGWQALIDDVHALRVQTQQKYPELPYYLLGHSMGSFVVRCYLMQYGQGLTGAVISGTGAYGAPMVLPGLLLANIACLFGAKKPNALINKIGFAGNNRPFEPARTPFDWLSRDAKVVDAYVADPLCGFVFTAAGFRDLFRGLRMMGSRSGVKRIPKDLPILFFSGDEDPVGAQGRGVRKVADSFRSAGLRSVEVHLYEGGRHEMLNEVNHETVETDLLQWMAEHAPHTKGEAHG